MFACYDINIDFVAALTKQEKYHKKFALIALLQNKNKAIVIFNYALKQTNYYKKGFLFLSRIVPLFKL
jgi:hypothetical protein